MFKILDGSTQVTFQKDIGIVISRIINFIAFLWFTQFIFGCQHFVISGKFEDMNNMSSKILVLCLFKEPSANGTLQEIRANCIRLFGRL